ncbi:MAG: hypothetical protein ABJF23_32200 [Bryobacteraceae bacterium]
MNAASFANHPDLGTVLVGRSIFTIFGRNLAVTTETASGTPLPTMLGGSSVLVNDSLAPLFYASPGQINFQVPSTGQRSPYSVRVRSAAGTSEAVIAQGAQAAPGIFTQSSGACGPGAIQNVASDGTVTLNTMGQSASPGSYISVYATGLGPVYFPPLDGMPAKSDPISPAQAGGIGQLGLDGFQQAAVVQFSALAPGFVGVNQLNILIPADAPEGCEVPLRLVDWASTSQPVTISIRRGGGPCQNPPLARIGFAMWRKVTTTGPKASDSSTTEAFSASLFEAPESLVARPQSQRQLQPGGVRNGGTSFTTELTCLGTSIKVLEAGPLTLKGPSGNAITLLPSSESGQIVYQTSLPAGTLQPGALQITSAGSSAIGAFQSAILYPQPIHITTTLVPGTMISFVQPFRVEWTGGTSDTVVRIQLVSTIPYSPPQSSNWEFAALASAGSATLPLMELLPGRFSLPVFPSDQMSVIVRVSPLTNAGTFTASGLSRPATHDWEYEYRFTGLSMR